jgi:thiamine biosynthesis lipoprotein
VQHEQRFRAMDTDVDVIIDAAAPPLASSLSVRLLFERQEEIFSRFRQASLLSRLNRGETVRDPQFAAACRLAFAAHDATAGLFNPLVLPALEAAGYDRTFADVAGGAPSGRRASELAAHLHLEDDSVSISGARLDLGGIVKGWTVDLAVELLSNEHGCALVNAGGDLRALGSESGSAGWLLAVAGPGGGVIWEGEMHGALATSTTLRRRWNTAGGAAHHLIDPRTGLPSTSPFVQASVWAPETWRAEVWAKAIVIGGHEAAERCMAVGLRALAVNDAGAVEQFPMR